MAIARKNISLKKLERTPAKFEPIKVDDPTELIYPKFFSDDSSGDEKKDGNKYSQKVDARQQDKRNKFMNTVEYISDYLSDDDDVDDDWIEVNNTKYIDINKRSCSVLKKVSKFQSILVCDDNYDGKQNHSSYNNNNNKIDLTTTQSECLSDSENTMDELTIIKIDDNKNTSNENTMDELSIIKIDECKNTSNENNMDELTIIKIDECKKYFK